MKGVSAVVVIVLILMIGLSITGLGYVTFTTLFSKITTSSEQAISNTLSNMLAQMKIEAVSQSGTDTMVYIRNNGKVDLTNFVAYVNDALATYNAPTGDKIIPGDVKSLKITSPVYASGNIIKITTAQGAIGIQAAP